MNVALVLQRFQLELVSSANCSIDHMMKVLMEVQADPEYELQLKSTLTIKPAGFKMKVRRRPGRSLMTGKISLARVHAKLI